MTKTPLNNYSKDITVDGHSFNVQTIEYRSDDSCCKGDFLELTVSESGKEGKFTLDAETTHQQKNYAESLHNDFVKDISKNPLFYVQVIEYLQSQENKQKAMSLLEQKLCDLAA